MECTADYNPAFNVSEYDRKITSTVPYYSEFHKQVTQTVKAFGYSSLSWLDVGCGTGTMAKLAIESFNIERLVLCDKSSEMISAAKFRLGGESPAEFINSSVAELKFKSEFDIVTSILVNHYLSDNERSIAVKNCFDALKKGGLMITFENIATNSDILESVYLKRWKDYQISQGKTENDAQKHTERYKRIIIR